MGPYIEIKKDKCIGCNACIRVCPVFEANQTQTVQTEAGEQTIININGDKCIGCGECVKTCEHGARTYIDDTQRFFNAIQKKEKITVIVAPAFRMVEPQADVYLQQLRELGVDAIYDVGFGADICTYMHIKAIKDGIVDKVVTQPCAALTEYIIKYKHELLEDLSPIHSPISCMAIYLRKYLNVTNPIACISPCIAKKYEFEETGLVQYNVTYKNIVAYLKAQNIRTSGEFKFDGLPAYCGKIYPRPGGLKACIHNMLPEITIHNAEGVSTVYKELDMYLKTPKQKRPDVLDVLSCAHGCISGPGTNFVEDDLYAYLYSATQVEQKAFKERVQQTVRILQQDKQYAMFTKQLKIEDFIRKYQPKNTGLKPVTEQQLNDAYRQLYKETYEAQHFDCHACGYPTCKQMAIAVASGLNTPSSCHQYMIKQQQIDEQIKQQQRMKQQQQQENVMHGVNIVLDNLNKITTDTTDIVQNCTENKTSMEAVKTQLAVLTEKCKEIQSAVDGITDVNKLYKEMSDAIQEITEQTHILSINASVEAARAGQAGKTFAVVANEIRTLAANTQETTQVVAESDTVILNSTTQVLNVAQEVENTVNTLLQILTGLSDSVEDTMQKSVVINGAIANIREVSETHFVQTDC